MQRFGRTERKDEIVRGRIIRSGYVLDTDATPVYDPGYEVLENLLGHDEAEDQCLIEVDGQLRFGLPGKPQFPTLGDDTILKPTLHWVLETDKAGRLDAELSYITSGIDWEADYSVLSPAEGDGLDVIGWITMDNQSGRTFEDAHIKLMAGDVSKVERGQLGGYASGLAAAARSDAVSEKAFDEYHLYTLGRSTTLRDRQTKQVEFLRTSGIRARRLYIYDGVTNVSRNPSERMRNDPEYGTRSDSKVSVHWEFQNSQTNHLGIPLPGGRVRFYRTDDDGRLEFTGENTIDHTPRDETVRIRTGNAFDLVGERKRTDLQTDTSRRTLDESFEIKLRNRKEADTVEIRVVEHLYRWITWEIVEKSDDFVKTDSQTIEFRIQVPAGEEKVVTYKVHYTW